MSSGASFAENDLLRASRELSSLEEYDESSLHMVEIGLTLIGVRSLMPHEGHDNCEMKHQCHLCNKALDHANRVFDTIEKCHHLDHLRSKAHLRKVDVHARRGEVDRARAEITAGRRTCRGLIDAEFLGRLANMQEKLKHSETLKLRYDAESIARLHGENSTTHLESITPLAAKLHYGAGERSDAADWYFDVLKRRQKVFAQDESETDYIIHCLSRCLLECGRFADLQQVSQMSSIPQCPCDIDSLAFHALGYSMCPSQQIFAIKIQKLAKQWTFRRPLLQLVPWPGSFEQLILAVDHNDEAMAIAQFQCSARAFYFLRKAHEKNFRVWLLKKIPYVKKLNALSSSRGKPSNYCLYYPFCNKSKCRAREHRCCVNRGPPYNVLVDVYDEGLLKHQLTVFTSYLHNSYANNDNGHEQTLLSFENADDCQTACDLFYVYGSLDGQIVDAWTCS